MRSRNRGLLELLASSLLKSGLGSLSADKGLRNQGGPGRRALGNHRDLTLNPVQDLSALNEIAGHRRSSGRRCHGYRESSQDSFEDRAKKLLNCLKSPVQQDRGLPASSSQDLIPEVDAIPIHEDLAAVTVGAETIQSDTPETLLSYIVSFLDGRARIRHRALKYAEVIQVLQGQLEQTGIFTGLQFNHRTGSLLMCYDSRQISRSTFFKATVPLRVFLEKWDQEFNN